MYALYMPNMLPLHMMIKMKVMFPTTFPHYPHGYPQFSIEKALIFGLFAPAPVEKWVPAAVFPPVESVSHSFFRVVTKHENIACVWLWFFWKMKENVRKMSTFAAYKETCSCDMEMGSGLKTDAVLRIALRLPGE